jgi:hypothetical protein
MLLLLRYCYYCALQLLLLLLLLLLVHLITEVCEHNSLLPLLKGRLA